jgi:hypothetical protein
VSAPAAAACPKCARQRPAGAAACDRCGLVFALWSPELAAEAVALDPEGERLWAAAEARWEEDAAHDAFVKHCSQRGLLGVAGRAYRGRLDRDAGDAVAARMQKRIIAMATAVLQPTRTAASAPVTRSRLFTWIVFFGLAVGVVAGLLWHRLR